ncbi:MAG: hypothetical protein WCK77_08560 [Verrucomicrobiota bacterium]
MRLQLVGYGAKAQGDGDTEAPPLQYTDKFDFDGTRHQHAGGEWYLAAYPDCRAGQVRKVLVGNLPGFPFPGEDVDLVVIVTGIVPAPDGDDYFEGNSTIGNSITVSGTVHLETREIKPVKSVVKDWSMKLELK